MTGEEAMRMTKKGADEPTDAKTCIKCQACCREVFIATAYAPEPKLLEFFTARGFREIVADERIFLEIDIDCPYLNENGCLIYPQRPALCKEYDGRKSGYPKCQLKAPKKTETHLSSGPHCR